MRAQLLMTATVASIALAACGGDHDATRGDSAAGDVAAKDSADARSANPTDTLRASARTPTAAAVPVGPSSAGRVAEATEYKLTDENFAAFLQASRRLSFLRARDPQIRTMLDAAKTDERMADRMEKNPQIAQALGDAGISVHDYQVAGVAIASARQFISAPAKAPPTPTLRDNAAFLAKHRDVLAQFDAWNR